MSKLDASLLAVNYYCDMNIDNTIYCECHVRLFYLLPVKKLWS